MTDLRTALRRYPTHLINPSLNPDPGVLELCHTWTDFDIFWQKCYR